MAGCYSAVAKCFVETPEQLRQLSLYSRGQQSAAATNTKGQQVQLADVAVRRQRDQMSLTMWI